MDKTLLINLKEQNQKKIGFQHTLLLPSFLGGRTIATYRINVCRVNKVSSALYELVEDLEGLSLVAGS